MKQSKKLDVLVIVVIVVLLSVCAASQFIDEKNYEQSCVTKTFTYNTTIPVYTESVFTHPNGTKELIYSKIKDNKTTTIISTTTCEIALTINDERVDFELQGYNCGITDGVITCDSCVDGNCDGKCSTNGGETCCRVIDDKITCKNGVKTWSEVSKTISVKKLDDGGVTK
jgi:hypothetical protein